MKHRTPRRQRTLERLGLACIVLFALAGCQRGGEDGPSAVDNADKAQAVDPSGSTDAPVRQNISDFVTDPDQVDAYRQAVETMRANSAADPSSVEYRTSLLFWANTHGYFGQGGHATSFEATVARRLPQCVGFFKDAPYGFSETKANETCQGYYIAASQEFEPDAFADGIWGTCQHTPHSCDKDKDKEKCEEIRRTPRFLPWHRLYLYYYELTLRKYSGTDRFALPYWNYFDYPADDSEPPNLWLPPLVTEGGSTRGNTFYDPLRTHWLNEQDTSMAPENASAKDAFAAPTFLDFSTELEGTPHGAMHCAAGNGCTAPHIGWVPVAGNDPVFYMHHANIDRLWQCWMNREAGEDTIDLDWAKANLGMPDWWYDLSFDFADENGQRITQTIADAFSPEVLAVRYTEEVDCRIDQAPPQQMPKRATLQAVHETLAETDMVLMSDKIDLTPQSLRVDLLQEAPRLGQDQKGARELLSSAGTVSPGVWLVLENIVVKEAPGYTYNVYISSKDQPERRALVTRFNFFGFGDHHGGHEGPASLGTRRYYLNDDIHEIGITSVEDISVQFVPTNAVTGQELDQVGASLISIDSVRLVL